MPAKTINQVFKQYNGFYVWLHKNGRIKHPKYIAKYLGRYVRHPAIANSRIYYYDGKIVKFFYFDNKNNRINVVMSVDEFISALIQHIPERQFRMIRYYGAYSRRSKKSFGIKTLLSIRQLNLPYFSDKVELRCPFCGSELEFVGYCRNLLQNK